MKVLFIDEDESSVRDGMARLNGLGHNCKLIDFNEDISAILLEYQPDIIVLDMMNGGATNDARGEGGKASFDTIWDNRFCPIVVYSANPDLIDNIDSGNAKHPLVQKVQKGRGSDEKLRDEINKFKPCVDGINGITEDVTNVLHITLRDVAPHIFSQNDITDKETAIKHMGRRRISVLMDGSSILRPILHPSEQYIYPPLDNYPKTGDILQDVSKDSKQPESFLVVLTPSCDLVKVDDRDPKVTDVLCAQCENSDALFSKAQVKKNAERLANQLSEGYIKEYLPIPEFPGIIPAMVANMKKLKLISYDDIGKKEEKKSFIIIASVDSPFREQITWAYMNTGGRPGVPDRDCHLWAKQYLDNGTAKEEKKS